jgi:predicted MFS family arabinose efflux permease
MPLGMMLAILAGPVINSWRMFWIYNAITASVMLFIILLVIPRSVSHQKASYSFLSMFRDIIKNLRQPGVFILVLCFITFNVMYFSVMSFLPVLLEKHVKLSAGTTGVISGGIIGINILGNLAAGFILKKGMARWKLLTVAYLLTGLIGFLIFRTFHLGFVVILCCALFSAVGGIIPSAILGGAAGLSTRPQSNAISIGLVMQGSNIGQVIGPVALGTIVDSSGWTSAGYLVIITAICGTVVSLKLKGILR